jgi:hypothetical protein
MVCQRLTYKKATPQAIYPRPDSGRGRYPVRQVAQLHGLVGGDYLRHFRIAHGDNKLANDESHINGIGSFGSFAKGHVRKFNGVRPETFHLHPKECVWRFNYGRDSLYRKLLRPLRRHWF